MKEYLLKPQSRIKILEENNGEIFLIDGPNSLRSMSPLISDKYFAFLHFNYDPECLIKSFYKEPCCKKKDHKEHTRPLTYQEICSFIQQSDIQLSLGFRKISSSIFSILKQYGLEEVGISIRNDRHKNREANSSSQSTAESSTIQSKNLL